MFACPRLLAATLLLLVSGVCRAPSASADEPQASEPSRRFTDEEFEFFEQKVRPVLFQHCYECHSGRAKNLKGGLRLDSRSGLLAGGDTGPAVVPGLPDQSALLAAVRYDDELQMPPEGKISAAEIEVLTRWIQMGAPFPELALPGKEQPQKPDPEQGRTFWSFVPARRSPQPAPHRPGWIQEPLDGFVVAELAAHGMEPAPPADSRTLVRRIYFDLIGLPPLPPELDAFAADPSPDRYERLVDRLLASPHYGERWGRFWLDLARYADQGEPWLSSIERAYLYRDWVVAALNVDTPYDDFVRRQLATDMLPETGPEDHAALGFLGLSPTYWKELRLDPNLIKTVVAEEWEERIGAVSNTFLGLTVECARCHDHKYDPITSADYYALAGVFASAQPADVPLIPEPQARVVAAARTRLEPLETELKKLQQPADTGASSSSEARTRRITELETQIREIRDSTPHIHEPWAHGVEEASIQVRADGPDLTKIEFERGVAQDIAIQLRGSPANPGQVVPRRFLSVLTPPGESRRFRQGSGRLELANAIFKDAASLASRVIVNRIWRQHFGRGLVDTPSNFGAQGSAPTHPVLLDHLAATFHEDGWSLKQLHRRIVLSATYRQTSAQNSVNEAADPENRWLWRMNRHRLEIEAWRDAMLVATDQLDRRMGGPAADLSGPENRRRTIYGTVIRPDLPEMLRLHDFPVPTAHSPGREPTTTPLQQLFVLNSSFLQAQSTALYQRLRAEAEDDSVRRIQLAYRSLFGRDPSELQQHWSREFLDSVRDGDSPDMHNDDPRDAAWQLYLQALLGTNEFLFID